MIQWQSVISRLLGNGGYVYRGEALTSLSGKYLYADYGTGNIWTLTSNGDGSGYTSERLLSNTGKTIASFAEDLNGEMYIVSLYTGEFLKLIETMNSPSKSGPPHNDSYPKPKLGWLLFGRPFLPHQSPLARLQSERSTNKNRLLRAPVDTQEADS